MNVPIPPAPGNARRPVLVVQAEDATGRTFQLHTEPRDEQHARETAARIAGWLGAIGLATRWDGCKVTVIDAVTRRLMAAARVNPRRVRV